MQPGFKASLSQKGGGIRRSPASRMTEGFLCHEVPTKETLRRFAPAPFCGREPLEPSQTQNGSTGKAQGMCPPQQEFPPGERLSGRRRRMYQNTISPSETGGGPQGGTGSPLESRPASHASRGPALPQKCARLPALERSFFSIFLSTARKKYGRRRPVMFRTITLYRCKQRDKL